MRMPSHHLGDDRLQHVIERERAFLGGKLRVIDALQKQIAKFLAQVSPVAARDCVLHLIGLLDGVGRDRLEALLQIPRAARARRAQGLHDGKQRLNAPGVHLGRISGHIPPFA